MHERLRTHAESVAFFGGGSREKEVFIIVLLIQEIQTSRKPVSGIFQCIFISIDG